MEIYKLTRVINFEGTEIKEISMDLEGLSVDDLEKAEKIVKMQQGKKGSSLLLEFNKKYHMALASRASNIHIEAFRLLSAKDYTGISLVVQDFLLGGDLEDEETESFTVNKVTQSGETQTLTKANGQEMTIITED